MHPAIGRENMSTLFMQQRPCIEITLNLCEQPAYFPRHESHYTSAQTQNANRSAYPWKHIERALSLLIPFSFSTITNSQPNITPPKATLRKLQRERGGANYAGEPGRKKLSSQVKFRPQRGPIIPA
jgi:hypothetical protein